MMRNVLRTATSWTSAKVAPVEATSSEHALLLVHGNQSQHATVTLAADATSKDGHASLEKGHSSLLSRIIATALAMPWPNPPLREVTQLPDDSIF